MYPYPARDCSLVAYLSLQSTWSFCIPSLLPMASNQSAPEMRYCQYCEKRVVMDPARHLPIHKFHQSRCTIVTTIPSGRHLVERDRQTAQFQCPFCGFACCSIENYQIHINKYCTVAESYRAVCMQGVVNMDQPDEDDYDADAEGGLSTGTFVGNEIPLREIELTSVKLPSFYNTGVAAQGSSLPSIGSLRLPGSSTRPAPQEDAIATAKPRIKRVRLIVRPPQPGPPSLTVYPGSDQYDSPSESSSGPNTPSDDSGSSTPRPSGRNAGSDMMDVDSDNAF